MAWRQGSIDDRDEREGARARERYKCDMREQERTCLMVDEHALHVQMCMDGLHLSAHGCARA